MDERFTTVRVFSGRQRDRVAGGYRWIRSQPSWVARAALLTFALIVGLPILLLLALAVLVSVVVFGSLALADGVARRLGGGPADDGRSNVRVIRRRERN